MADEEFGRRIPFAFLEDVKSNFKAQYGDKVIKKKSKKKKKQ
jgi:vesicle-associated membrane protein 7